MSTKNYIWTSLSWFCYLPSKAFQEERVVWKGLINNNKWGCKQLHPCKSFIGFVTVQLWVKEIKRDQDEQKVSSADFTVAARQWVKILHFMQAFHDSNNYLQYLMTVLLNGAFPPGLSCVCVFWCMWGGWQQAKRLSNWWLVAWSWHHGRSDCGAWAWAAWKNWLLLMRRGCTQVIWSVSCLILPGFRALCPWIHFVGKSTVTTVNKDKNSTCLEVMGHIGHGLVGWIGWS